MGILIPVEDPKIDHDRMAFLDNHSKEPVMALYRTTEKVEPMAHLWAETY